MAGPIWQRSLNTLLLRGLTRIANFETWEEAERVRKILNTYHDALAEALSFQNEDTECLVGPQSGGGPDAEDEREPCPDRRCHDHGCMVQRINGWRAAVVNAGAAS